MKIIPSLIRKPSKNFQIDRETPMMNQLEMNFYPMISVRKRKALE